MISRRSALRSAGSEASSSLASASVTARFPMAPPSRSRFSNRSSSMSFCSSVKA